jgi:pre-mRNA-splicing helicase BRR2
MSCLYIEVAMRENGLGWILRELAGDRQAKAQTGNVMDSSSTPISKTPHSESIFPIGETIPCV